MDRLINAQLRLVEGIDRMADVTEQRLNALAEALNALAAAQKLTEERLNSLVALVARYISGRDGGEAPR